MRPYSQAIQFLRIRRRHWSILAKTALCLPLIMKSNPRAGLVMYYVSVMVQSIYLMAVWPIIPLAIAQVLILQMTRKRLVGNAHGADRLTPAKVLVDRLRKEYGLFCQYKLLR